MPINPRTGKAADVSDPATWGTFEEAWACACKRSLDGVGFVFTADDPFTGIDLDDCLDPDTEEARLGADDVIDILDSYTEISPSGKGLKSIVRATKPGDRYFTKSTPWGGNFEMYDQSRFFALTGVVYRDGPVREAQEAVDALYRRFLSVDRPEAQDRAIKPSTGFPGDDDELLETARSCKQTGERFRSLYDVGGIPVGERSEADRELCRMLGYWTGGDHEWTKSLFKKSALAQGKFQEKGRHGEKYLDMTVSKAIQSLTSFYDPSFGERMKAQVREIVAERRLALPWDEMREAKRRLVACVLEVAATRGKLEKGAVEFNLNQEETGEMVGLSQRSVSGILKEVLSEGWLERVSVGRPGKNSSYRLKAVEPSSTTYVHSSPSVRLRSRTDSQSPTIGEAPFIDSVKEIYAPVVETQAKVEMAKNLPPKGEDGIYHHPAECMCWFCDEDAPEYVPANDLGEVA